MTNNQPPSDAPARSTAGRFALASLVLAILIAAVLQFAAAAKVAHGSDALRRMKDAAVLADNNLPHDFDARDYQWLATPSAELSGGIPLDFPIAGLEFAMVVLVLAAHRRRFIWLVVPLMFATFFGYALQKNLSGLPCGCFGDLWHPPPGVSLAIDALFVVGALALAALRRTPPKVLLATIALSVVALGAGYTYAWASKPERKTPAPPAETEPDTDTEPDTTTAQDESPTPRPAPTLKSAAQMLLESPLLADVRNAGPEPAYYVFIWDPTCTTCERLKPIIDFARDQYEAEGNPFLQVLSFKKQPIEDQTGIVTYDWETSPTVFVVQDGVIVAESGGEESFMPDDILAKLQAGEPLTDE